jgi:hypothetical protein
MKRRAIDFTTQHVIEVWQSENSGRYWSQICQGRDVAIWTMCDNTDSRSEAFDLACNRLDALAEQYVSEGEPEDDGSGLSEDQHADRNGVPRRS